jgi:hypothetical protein
MPRHADRIPCLSGSLAAIAGLLLLGEDILPPSPEHGNHQFKVLGFFTLCPGEAVFRRGGAGPGEMFSSTSVRLFDSPQKSTASLHEAQSSIEQRLLVEQSGKRQHQWL